MSASNAASISEFASPKKALDFLIQNYFQLQHILTESVDVQARTRFDFKLGTASGSESGGAGGAEVHVNLTTSSTDAKSIIVFQNTPNVTLLAIIVSTGEQTRVLELSATSAAPLYTWTWAPPSSTGGLADEPDVSLHRVLASPADVFWDGFDCNCSVTLLLKKKDERITAMAAARAFEVSVEALGTLGTDSMEHLVTWAVRSKFAFETLVSVSPRCALLTGYIAGTASVAAFVMVRVLELLNPMWLPCRL